MEKASPITIKIKAIEDKYQKIFDYLDAESNPANLSKFELINTNADATQKMQSEKNALLLADINDYKAKESALIAEWDAKMLLPGVIQTHCQHLIPAKPTH